jgi:RimJ/RimL family protein N-acetyltransferase
MKMRFIEKMITLSNGTTLTLRSPDEGDAEGMLAYLKMTAAETHFLLRKPEEVTNTIEEEKSFLCAVLENRRKMMISAFAGDNPVGNLFISPIGDRQKVRHRAEFGMAVIQTYWGLGLGSLLLRDGLHAAKDMGFEQMELFVCADNVRAIRLYEQFGFEHWGRLKNGFKLTDGTYRDDLMMGRSLIDI